MYDILSLARAQAKQMTLHRRTLHQIPELALHLPQTVAYVCKQLDKIGIEYESTEAYSGVVALLGKPDGKTIAIRADMDALPIVEESGEPFASVNGNMHACGHDIHTSILLGTAAVLKQIENELDGQVKLIFQSSEEVAPGGANLMVEDGVLENPHVDAILALHVETDPNRVYPVGDLSYRYGSIFAWEEPVEIIVHGQGGHGSKPSNCVDPIAVANLIYSAFQTMYQREIDPTAAAVFSIGTISAGNGMSNIIPDTALIKGTLRTLDAEVKDYALRRMEEISRGIAKVMHASVDFSINEGCPAVVNDDMIVDLTIKSATSLFGSEHVHMLSSVALEAEDAGYYFQKVPGCYFRFNTYKPHPDGKCYPAHNSKFCLDDSQLYKAAAVFAQTAYDFLKSDVT